LRTPESIGPSFCAPLRAAYARGYAGTFVRRLAAVDVRLVQLLGSFVAARSEYSLARLEFAMRHPKAPAPPIIDKLGEPSERALREEWPQVERQLESAVAFARDFERRSGVAAIAHVSYRRLERSLRELDQYARAIVWVLTVTES
jgi:hypothetical protein